MHSDNPGTPDSALARARVSSEHYETNKIRYRLSLADAKLPFYLYCCRRA